MFFYFTQLKLASLDKKITTQLLKSKWYADHKDRELDEIPLSSIDRNEEWVILVKKFINIVVSTKKYNLLIQEYDLTPEDLIDIFLLMTIVVMPDPIFLSGKSRLSNTLVGSSVYQEIDRQLIPLLGTTLQKENSEADDKLFERDFANSVMSFALVLKSAHDSAYGKVSLESYRGLYVRD